jgi:hypothetical protein
MNHTYIISAILIGTIAVTGGAYAVGAKNFYQTRPVSGVEVSAKAAESTPSNRRVFNIEVGNGPEATVESEKPTTPAEQTNLIEAVISNPIVEKIIENNPKVKEILEGVKSTEDLASKICEQTAQLETQGIDIQDLTVEMIKPTIGENSEAYLTILKKIDKDCIDNKMDVGEMAELASMTSKLNIDLSKMFSN